MRIATIATILVLLLCVACADTAHNQKASSLEQKFSVSVSYDEGLQQPKKRFGESQKQTKPEFTHGIILEITDEGVLRWRKPPEVPNFKTRQLTEHEIEGLSNRIREVVDNFDETVRPFHAIDLSTISITLYYGEKEVCQSYISDVDHFFSNGPLFPGLPDEDKLRSYKRKKANKRLECLIGYLGSLCSENDNSLQEKQNNGEK